MQRAQEQQAELASLIEQIEEILSRDRHLAAYFRTELDWLERRKKLWQTDAFRIGLIGVTSSGKSTLINALLGDELLPKAVRPSSNSLVVCEWGEKLQCVVHFKDPTHKPRALIGDAIAAGLQRYADEATNAGNHKGVEEIRLRSPNFRLGRGVLLIDTPGLDAFGHDDHEKLTLEVLLPTVDAVLFVTTCKANSDEKMSEYVCLARDLDKPVIVVQNMIDSVVEKTGHAGEVLKSKTEVLDEHRKRLLNVLKKSGIESVEINQVSAVWALKRQLKRSGVPALVANIKHHLDRLAPVVAEGRRTQLTRWTRNLITKELASGDQSAVLERQKANLASLVRLSNTLDERYNRSELKFEAARASIAQEAAQLSAEVSTLNATSIDSAYDLKTRVEKWLRSSPAQLSALNKALVKQIADDCESLNLRHDDINLNVKFSRQTNDLSFETTERSRTVKDEQLGFSGRAKRWFGGIAGTDWGYNERRITWDEIANFGAFQKSLESAISHEVKYVDRFVRTMVDRIQTVSAQLKEELDSHAEGVRKKMSATTAVAHRGAIAQELRALLRGRKGYREPDETPAPAAAAPSIDEHLHEIDVSPAVLYATRLATRIARRRFLDMRDEVLFDQAQAASADCGRVLIAGFDDSSLIEFVNRFWFDMLEAEDRKLRGFTLLDVNRADIRQIAVASLNGAGSTTLKAVNTFLSKPCVLFLVIDAQQIGASGSLLQRTDIPFAELQIPIVAVVQSIKELEQSNSIAEALFELGRLAESFGFTLAGALVNDQQVLYSTLANWLLGPSMRIQTVADETQLMDLLPTRSRKQAIAVVRSWRALTP